MRTKLNISLLLLLVACAMATTSCRKGLCYTHPHDGSITINIDWRNLPQGVKKPAGAKVLFVRSSDQNVQSVNFPAAGGSRDLTQGDYSIMAMNNDPEMVLYRGLNKWETAEAFTPARRQPAYSYAPSNIQNAAAPEPRYGISAPDLLMSSNEGRVFVSEITTEKQTVTVTPECLVKPIIVRISATGIKNVAEARGFIKGVSSSVLLSNNTITQNEGMLLFEYGSAKGGTELMSQFMVFGFVDKPEAEYMLGLEMLLIDQKTVLYFEFVVNDQITPELKANGGTIKIAEIINIPDVEPPSGGGGFNPGIGGWGDETDIEIPF